MTVTTTISGKKLGISDFKVTRGLGNQQKVAEFQKAVSKLTLDAQAKLTELTRDGRLVDSLKKDKSEDQRIMQKLAEKYDMNIGPFDPDLWDVYKSGIGTSIEIQIEPLINDSSAEMILKRAKLSFGLIEDMAGITTKKAREKLEGNNDLTMADLNEVTNEIISFIMDIKNAEPTEDDRKSQS